MAPVCCTDLSLQETSGTEIISQVHRMAEGKEAGAWLRGGSSQSGYKPHAKGTVRAMERECPGPCRRLRNFPMKNEFWGELYLTQAKANWAVKAKIEMKPGYCSSKLLQLPPVHFAAETVVQIQSSAKRMAPE